MSARIIVDEKKSQIPMKRVKGVYFVALFPLLPDETRVERRIVRPPMISIRNLSMLW
jgi:hypothetical protein